MQMRTLVTLAVAILLGLVAVLLVRNYLGKNQAGRPGLPGQPAAVAGVPIVVASQKIERGAALQPGFFKIVNVPADAKPEGSFDNIQQLSGTQAQQRYALHSFAPNEPILASKVTGPGGRATMSATLAEGMRAVSLRSNEVAGVAGFVLPGDRVDILLTRTMGTSTVTQTLADNVLVLGVDQLNSDETDKPIVARAVTIQVTPEQAQSITLAQSVGGISLALRSVSDQGLPMKRATTVADLGFNNLRLAANNPGPAPAPEPAAGVGGAVASSVRKASAGVGAPTAPTGESVRVYRGTDLTSYQVGVR